MWEGERLGLVRLGWVWEVERVSGGRGEEAKMGGKGGRDTRREKGEVEGNGREKSSGEREIEIKKEH